MKKNSSSITLAQTSRGVWGLDTVKGCKYGMKLHKNGCYGACYAKSIADRYGYDFSDSTLRRFGSAKHLENIISGIKSSKSDFVRVGIIGDPSECWGHTIDICDKIKSAGKKVVLITKHWEPLPDYLYEKVNRLGLIINTSVSALDSDKLIRHRLNEYRKLKEICTSVLRVVSCDFNLNSINGLICNEIQESLFDNENVIDTVLRVSDNHYLVRDCTINIESKEFLSGKTRASMKNKNTHFGYCSKCSDRCGTGFKNE